MASMFYTIWTPHHGEYGDFVYSELNFDHLMYMCMCVGRMDFR